MPQSRLYNYFKTHPKSSLDLLICEDDKEASELADVARYFGYQPLVFPDFRAAYLDDLLLFLLIFLVETYPRELMSRNLVKLGI